MATTPMDKITFNRDKKFDIQLTQTLVHERRPAERARLSHGSGPR
jgi:hypothetical protein